MTENEVKVVDDVVGDVTKDVAEEIACTTKPNGTGIAVLVTGITALVVGGIWLGKKIYAHFKGKNEETTQENTTEVVEENPEENIEAEA